MFVSRLALSPVELQNSMRQNQCQFCFCRAASVQLEVHPGGNAGRCAYFLAFQFSLSVSPSFLCFVNCTVGRCFDMLMCKENLPAVAQGEAVPKPGRLSRMFLQVHIIPHHSHPALCCAPVPSSLVLLWPPHPSWNSAKHQQHCYCIFHSNTSEECYL